MNRKLNSIFKDKKYNVFSINENATIKEAVIVLIDNRIGSLLVLDESENIAGIFTERDVLKKLASTDGQVGNLKVKELMTDKKDLIIGQDDDKMDYLMQVMSEHKIRHLPIIKEDGSLLGVLSMRDIIKVLLKESKQRVKFLNDYISGRYPN
ncbi:MAG: CBS domain-containing protein [Candidatus Cloacimonetes bacterium]|nr:CBS domain-containing protein [Candidatus Cloacimonadota bacterium]